MISLVIIIIILIILYNNNISGSTKRSKTGDLSWLVRSPVDGGPRDGTVIPSFLGHVASRMWAGETRSLLKCQSRVSVIKTLQEWYSQMSPSQIELVESTGLSHLQFSMLPHLDWPLICAFVERWQPDTNSFHMPFGEMTIMMHDVWHILRIPVDGGLISAVPSTAEMQSEVMDLFEFDADQLKRTFASGRVLNQTVINRCQVAGDRDDTDRAIGWVWLLIGSTLFVEKSGGNRILASCLHELRDGLAGVDGYSWGSATLAYLYRQLGIASRGDCAGIAGCLTLLQCWIYEYFPCFRPQREQFTYLGSDDQARSTLWDVRAEAATDSRTVFFRKRIDSMSAAEVTDFVYIY